MKGHAWAARITGWEGKGRRSILQTAVGGSQMPPTRKGAARFAGARRDFAIPTICSILAPFENGSAFLGLGGR